MRGFACLALTSSCGLAGCISPSRDIPGTTSSGGTTSASTDGATTPGETTASAPPTGTTLEQPSTGLTTDGSGTLDATSPGSSTATDDGLCGDAIVGPREECDDGNMNDSDGCGQSCEFESLVVFVTSVSYSGDEIGTVLGGDAKCTALAANHDALNGRAFVAWLSCESVDARDQIGLTDRPYVLSDMKTLVANGSAGLLDGMLDAAIYLDQKGAEPVPLEVWTGTMPDGTGAGDDCNGWTLAVNHNGMTGHPGATDGTWTANQAVSCAEMHPIFCIQKPK